MNSSEQELLHLTNLMLEDQLSAAQGRRLAELLKASPVNMRLYVDLVELHGQLMWDAGLAPVFEPHRPKSSTGRKKAPAPEVQQRRRWSGRAISASAAGAVLVLIGLAFAFTQFPDQPPQFVQPEPGGGDNRPDVPDQSDAPLVADSRLDSSGSDNSGDVAAIKPLPLNNLPDRPDGNGDVRTADASAASTDRPSPFQGEFSDEDVVAFIDAQLQKSWDDNGLQPSRRADDTEWLRRAYLSFVGRIPTLGETDRFTAGTGPADRGRLVHDLAESAARAENLAEIWANLLVGRSPRTEVNRDALQDFLKDEFVHNSPWIDTVGKLISAEGRNDRNGATNFLLAHLNNDATPATAVTARLFLGEQLQCVQCHDHPFDKGISQKSYWALNAFFKHTHRVTRTETVPGTTDGSDPQTRQVVELLDDREGGMTHYETLRGEVRAVLPEFDSVALTADQKVNRRQELVRLLAADSEARVGRAMVNRMWAHFFSYGFTRPIDDIGPHVPVSHPELLDGLTSAFVESGYDVRRLMTWIAMCRAWQLSSEGIAGNVPDDPDSGETPMFSRVYVRRMTPEQVYRSIRVAIRAAADASPRSITTESESDAEHRRYWVAQFVRDYETDENDESAEFDGTVAQALVMMNGEEIEKAIREASLLIVSGDSGTNRRTREASPMEALNRVSLALLTRPPTNDEQRAFRAHLRDMSGSVPAGEALPLAVEDMLWAYLNSSEFMLVH
ncbi:MAG: DUF1549 domain-containing protein [Planctomycetaceae bacterium]